MSGLLDPAERSARGAALRADITGQTDTPADLWDESWRDFIFAEVWSRPGLDRRGGSAAGDRAGEREPPGGTEAGGERGHADPGGNVRASRWILRRDRRGAEFAESRFRVRSPAVPPRPVPRWPTARDSRRLTTPGDPHRIAPMRFASASGSFAFAWWFRPPVGAV